MPRTGRVPTWYLLSVPASVRSQLREEGCPLRWEAGVPGGGMGCRDGLTRPPGPGPLHPRPWELPKEIALGLLAAWTGVWSVVGDLYCEKLRTLSTNWNLKFQRGETEGPYPRVEMALGFFPPRLLFFVLISPWFLHLSGGWGGGTGDRRVLSTRRKRKCQAAQESWGLEDASDLARAGDSLLHVSGP